MLIPLFKKLWPEMYTLIIDNKLSFCFLQLWIVENKFYAILSNGTTYVFCKVNVATLFYRSMDFFYSIFNISNAIFIHYCAFDKLCNSATTYKIYWQRCNFTTLKSENIIKFSLKKFLVSETIYDFFTHFF